jgi:hypothetical protein
MFSTISIIQKVFSKQYWPLLDGNYVAFVEIYNIPSHNARSLKVTSCANVLFGMFF